MREMQKYCAKNNILEAKLCKNAFGDVYLFKDMQNGRKLKEKTVIKVEKFMSDYPDFSTFMPLKKPKKAAVKKHKIRPKSIFPHSHYVRNPISEIAPITVFRDPCFYCGVRGDIGCRHKPVYDDVSVKAGAL
jgi:hypothetical protein